MIFLYGSMNQNAVFCSRLHNFRFGRLQIIGMDKIYIRILRYIADHVILPGVGAFGDAMGKLHKYGLVEVIREAAERKTPFLGICLGLQLLFESSEESIGVEGLGLLPGRILRIPEEKNLKIPHIGWNSLKYPAKGRLFRNIPENSYVYFVHSYYLQAAEPEISRKTSSSAPDLS